MKRYITIVLPVFLMLYAAALRAAEIDLERVADELNDLRTYTTGDSTTDLRFLEKAASDAVTDAALRAKIETMIRNALKKTETAEGKSFLCRLLRTAGTAHSVPQLEALLTDRALSHMARYALGRIDCREAKEALRRGLDKTARDLKAGIINTLARIEYRKALPSVCELVTSNNKTVAASAARALGRFGGSVSAKTLLEARGGTDGTLRVEINNALLACAEKFLAEGEKKQASRIYRLFYKEKQSTHLTLAGLRGLAASSGREAAKLLTEAVKSKDRDLSGNAIQMLALMQGGRTTRLLVSLFKSLVPEKKILVIGALANRSNASAASLIQEAAESPHDGVRTAAYEALIGCGSVDTITILAEAASGDGTGSSAAKASLAGLRGRGLARKYIRALEGLSPEAQIEIIETLGQRNMTETVSYLHTRAAKEDNDAIRQALIKAMGRAGGRSSLAKLLDLAASPKKPADRAAIRESIKTLFKKIDGSDAKTRILIKRLKTASSGLKPVLLRLLAETATTPALNAVSSALQDKAASIREAAIKSLSDWPDARPLRALFRTATTCEDPHLRTLAINGFIRLSDFAENPTALYLKALKLTSKPEDVKRILLGMGKTGTLASLETALSYMKKAPFRREATRAASQIAGKYCWQDREKAVSVLNAIKSSTDDQGVRNRIKRTFQELKRFKGHVRAWKGAGPYTVKGVNDGSRVFNTVFPPEKNPDAGAITWRSIRTETGRDRIDLEKSFGSIDYCCAYLRTGIISPEDQVVRCRHDVDDYFKAWLNGKPVTGDTLKLKKGANTFMIKVGDHGGGWNFNCRLETLDGAPVEGLSFKL